MIRKFLMTIVFFIVLVGTAYAVPITYYFGGTLEQEFGTSPIGTQFNGHFSYDSEAPVESYGMNEWNSWAMYQFTELSLTLNNTTLNFDVTDELLMVFNGGSLNVLEVEVVEWESQMCGLYTSKVILEISDYSGNSFNGTDLPGSGIILSDLEGSRTRLILQGFSSELGGYTSLNMLTYFSATDPATPVPEPATILLLGTGLMGIIGIGRRKTNRIGGNS